MSADNSGYTVGPGRPPLHTRFRKGQSGNPSGKPGPAKLRRQRFQRALHAALDSGMSELRDSRPRSNLDAMVRRLMLHAADGDRGAMKLVLAQLDNESAREDPASPSQADGNMTQGAEEMTEEQDLTEPPPMPDYALWRKANPDD